MQQAGAVCSLFDFEKSLVAIQYFLFSVQYSTFLIGLREPQPSVGIYIEHYDSRMECL